jgi:hypothetical protein
VLSSCQFMPRHVCVLVRTLTVWSSAHALLITECAPPAKVTRINEHVKGRDSGGYPSLSGQPGLSTDISSPSDQLALDRIPNVVTETVSRYLRALRWGPRLALKEKPTQPNQNQTKPVCFTVLPVCLFVCFGTHRYVSRYVSRYVCVLVRT